MRGQGCQMGASRPKIFIFLFVSFEGTPGAPSPQKPHIKAGSLSKLAQMGRQPAWGGFGVNLPCGAGAAGGSEASNQPSEARSHTGNAVPSPQGAGAQKPRSQQHHRAQAQLTPLGG